MRLVKNVAITPDELRIDEQVIADSADDNAWGIETCVPATLQTITLRLPNASLHKANMISRREGFSSTEDWLMHLLHTALDAPAIRAKAKTQARTPTMRKAARP